MPIPENPTIKIAFTGLLAFCFDPKEGETRSRCQVGILRADRHQLTVKIFKVTPTRTEEIRISGMSLGDRVAAAASVNRSNPNPHDVFLTVKNPALSDVRLHANGPFARDESDDPNDFRWIPDIEGPEFHDRHLPVKIENLRPSLRMNNGLFYTAQKVSAVKQRKNDEPVDMDVAAFTAANIYLRDDPSSEAVLTFGDGESYSFRKENGTTYKIQFYNLCSDPTPTTVAGDFKQYYNAFEVPNVDEHFNLLGPLRPGSPDTHDSPCGPATGGRSTSFA